MTITQWIADVLSKPNVNFGGLPACPYALSAKLIEVDSFRLPLDGEVVVVHFDEISPGKLRELAIAWSDDTYVALEDHPDDPEFVGNFQVNYGKPIIMIQKRKHIEDARASLVRTKYYDDFSDESKDDLFSR